MLFNLKTSISIHRVLFCLLLVVSFLANSQSADNQIKKGLEDFMITDNPRKGIDNLLSLEGIVDQTGDSLQGQFYLNLGIAYGQVNHADSSFLYLDKAEKIAQKTNSDFLLAMINNTRGLVFMGKADYEASLNSYQEVMRIAEGKNDPKLNDVLSKTYGNLGGVYYQLGQVDKALETTKKCLKLSETIKDTTDIALNHLRLAMVYNDLNQLDDGINHLTKAKGFFKNLNNPAMLVYAESSLGKVFLKKQLLDSAYSHYEQAYKYSQVLGDQEENITALLAMANVKAEQSELREARQFAKNALVKAKSNGFANSEQKAYELLYRIAKKKGEDAEALKHLNASIKLKDSLGNVEIKARIAELETQYETAKKEKEIQKLTYESQLKSANLLKARNEKIMLIVGSLVIIATLLLFFITKHKKRKSRTYCTDPSGGSTTEAIYGAT